MELNQRTKILLMVLGAVTCIAIGRYTVPESTHQAKETSENKQKEVSVEKEKNVDTVTTETKLPDGTVTTVTHKVEQELTKKDAKSSSETEIKEEKDVKRAGHRVVIGPVAAIDVTKPTGFDFGASVSSNFAGPAWFTVQGLLNGRVSLSVGLEF